MNILSKSLLYAGLVLFACTVPSLAKTSVWPDGQGNTFKAEPSGVFGPFALFKTPNGGGRRVLLRMLSTEDLKRFIQETASKPSASATWAQSKSNVGYVLRDRLLEIHGDKAISADLSKRAEPELYIIFFGSAWGGESYETTELFKASYDRLKRLYGDRIETVFMGVRHDDQGNVNLAKATHAPWLIADYRQQGSIGV